MTSDQSALFTKAPRSIDSAKALMARGDYDFAASLAYHAMFYAAEALLLSKGLCLSSHSAVTAAVGQHFARLKLIDPQLHRFLIEAETPGSRAMTPFKPTFLRDRLQIAHADRLWPFYFKAMTIQCSFFWNSGTK